ncbi:lactate utilization protein B [Arenibacter sp. ARW7G5Y1]|uniref:lactate utilization protein B n=1 Tax=Arenibacter sp. ARW7G5Y1 TaxID=2135619 RepID=UPI000D76BCE2|nr:lactate utilization protein B [Arenibacter sp. ARW7G5Y1]PXX23996.1 L-lactate dehydrogenase complex protein LldF [Arenibacter sp. ARW7G5Y1]|tara:strand:- start:32916 stop:34274 length:1359 start_codon:yes stop_codon:yes gene_type:complete
MLTHSQAAKEFNKDESRVDWHDKAIWHLRQNRDLGVNKIPNWQQLRETASEIKLNVLSHLDTYLEEFEKMALSNGVHVHWALDGDEHNKIVKDILEKHSVQKLVKSKSMLTEECNLNPYLEKYSIEIVDTDLGERIIQLAKEKPSHITAPAIHKKKEEIDQLFQKMLGTPPSNGDAQFLVNAARTDLRKKFLNADAAITGVNFAIAESGGFVVCTNEGNADLGVHLAPVHIACMGIEKIIPKLEHLGVFLRLLARSANGQSITSYSSHFFKPRKGQEMHIVIVDNGRSKQLASEDFRNSLKCIRCGACMNTCPIYRRSGGHSYGSTIPGPIGSILSPNIDLKKYSSLPFASTLCGSCTDVCPVKIDIHSQLYKWRQIIMKEHPNRVKQMAMKTNQKVFEHPRLYNIVGIVMRRAIKLLPKSILYNKLNIWGKQRDLPNAPKKSFKEWYNERS